MKNTCISHTDNDRPHWHLGVIPLDEELQDVGVEAQGSQVDDVIVLIVLAQDIGPEVYEAFDGCQGPGAGRQQEGSGPHTGGIQSLNIYLPKAKISSLVHIKV